MIQAPKIIKDYPVEKIGLFNYKAKPSDKAQALICLSFGP
jgi:hypothetical protein